MDRIKRHPHIVAIVTALILLTVLFLGSILVGNFVQKNPESLKIDAYFYNLIANGPHNAFFDMLVWPINNNFLHVGGTNIPSYFLVLLGLFLIYLAIFKRKVLGWALIMLLISNFLIGSIYVFDSHYIFRQRPYVTLPNNLSDSFKNALLGWNSFPSGHVRDTVVYSMIIATFIPPLTIPMIIFSLFVGWSRLYVGAHFPSDVVSGIIIGVVIGKLALIFTKEAQTAFRKLRHRND